MLKLVWTICVGVLLGGVFGIMAGVLLVCMDRHPHNITNDPRVKVIYTGPNPFAVQPKVIDFEVPGKMKRVVDPVEGEPMPPPIDQ